MRSFTGRRDGLLLGEGRLGSTPSPCFGAGAGLLWANLAGGNALDAWDFTTNQARWNSASIGPLSNTPGWSYTRADAQTAYAQTSAGVLTPFATGVLRRTDKGVLIEGARTNLCLQSQALGTTPWTATNGGVGAVPTVTNNYAAAPDGTTTASRVQCSLAGGTASADQSLCAQVLTGTSCRGSFYLKTADGTTKNVYLRGASATSVTVTGSWQRFDFDAGTLTATQFAVGLRGAQGLTNSDSVDLLVWGAQLEAAAFPSSYIPTTTASATRAADVLTVPVSGIDYPISLFAEGEYAGSVTATGHGFLSISDGTNNERVLIAQDGSSPGKILVQSQKAGATEGSVTSAASLSLGVAYKVAGRVTTNDFRAALAGTLTSQDATAANPATPTTIRFGNIQSGGSNNIWGYLRRCALWTRALSDSELQTVTT